MTAVADGVLRADFKPSDGGGPAFGLTAIRLATDSFDMGILRLGASTTLATSEDPRAIRMVCVRW